MLQNPALLILDLVMKEHGFQLHPEKKQKTTKTKEKLTAPSHKHHLVEALQPVCVPQIPSQQSGRTPQLMTQAIKTFESMPRVAT